MFDLVRSDMCNSRSSIIVHIKDSVDHAFSLGFNLLEDTFTVVRNVTLIRESVYYIAG